MKRSWIILFFIFSVLTFYAQEHTPVDTVVIAAMEQPSDFYCSGYLKNLQSLQFNKDFNTLRATNLIHNRINLKWKAEDELIFAAELRNRLIWGDDVRSIPDYEKILRNPNERINLSGIWFSNNSLIMHTNIDRLYVNYTYKNLSARFGRQRINWGIATTWNPNDLFNTFNFLDFDYEERPGSDAIKLTGEFSNFSGAEIAYAPGQNYQGRVWAMKYYFNTKGYDIQLIAGRFSRRFTAGFGWAGNIRDAGFKGELQYFGGSDTDKRQLNLVLESDYVFAGNWYLNGALLFNNTGADTEFTQPAQINFNFSPANLMPTKWNFMVTTSKEITPLFSTTIAVLYAPGTDLLLLLPGFRYSLTENMDADMIWQSFFVQLNRFEGLDHRLFLRLKYCY